MSCRTTRAGSVATTFLSTYYGLEDCQATSIFHALKRESNNSEGTVSDTQVTAALDAIENHAMTSPEFNVRGLRGRALTRIQAARDENIQDKATRYALCNSLRVGEITQAVIRAYSEMVEEATRQPDMPQIEASSEFRRIVREHAQAQRQDGELFRTFIADTENINHLPTDSGTRYATAVFRRGNRCSQCGQFIGIVHHSCPQQEAVSPSLSANTTAATGISDAAINVAPDSRAEQIDSREFEVSIEEFQDLYDAVRDDIRAQNPHMIEIPSDTVGAVTAHLAAPQTGRSFGIEIEVDFPDEDYPYFDGRHTVARQMYQEGISLSPYVERWHYVGDDRPGGNYRQTPSEWVCEFDRSVDPYDGERGLEIKSQILFDVPETWRNLGTICSLASSAGARPTERTGLHINMGAADFSTNNPSRHNRLLKLAAAFDDTLVRLAHNPESGAWHRGRAYCGYADVPPDGFSTVAGARARSNHYQAFNLGHLSAEGQSNRISSRIEMRLWDGAISVPRIQTALNVSLAMVELSKYQIHVSLGHQPAGVTRDRFGPTRLEGDAWTAATEPFRQFMGLYKMVGLSSDVQQRNLMGLFAESRWPKRW